MHLSKLEIANFRSLKSLTVDLRPGLNVMVGRNNTGKTNLLHAIRHALGPSASRGDALWLDRDDFYRESPADAADRTISITLTFSDLTEAQRAYFFEIVDFDLSNLSNSTAIVRFEASWPSGKKRASIKRTGGPVRVEPPEVPAKILESLPVTFLPALRDAEACLSPGHRSRLALLLRDLAARSGDDTQKEQILKIYGDANQQLEDQALIKNTKDSLQETARNLAGSDYSAPSISAAETTFERILRSLRVRMGDTPIESLDANGLGYNNLLYMAVVLEHLKHHDEDECPLLLVEEPEAHLHPQLTKLLADYLSNRVPGNLAPQTLVTTHSPTLAASVKPSRIHVLFTPPGDNHVRCNGIARAKLTEREEADLQRMMDITRATLYFAKGALLVEGVSEALLVPSLASRMGRDLTSEHVSVIPICGVSFRTFAKLLGPDVLGIPVSIVTDGDPEVERTSDTWDGDNPKTDADGAFVVCDRVQRLEEDFAAVPTVKVCRSKVTLEYDLAAAGAGNALVMAEAWAEGFVGEPRTFNRARVEAAGADASVRALVAWRGICRANATCSKAEFAHKLSARLLEKGAGDQYVCAFEVPEYLKLAIEYALPRPAPQEDVGAE